MMKLNLEQSIVDEFPSPAYDRDFINDIVKEYPGDINYEGDLAFDNTGLLFYIFDSLNAILHPSMDDAEFDLDEYCENNVDFDDAMNGTWN
jgi:hypothetical protein